MRTLILFLIMEMSACSAQGTARLYTGVLEPVSGVCDPAARAQLVLRGNTAVFAPDSGTLVLNGVKADSEIKAALVTTGVDKKPYRLQFVGTASGSQIKGVYQDGRCRYGVSLSAVSF